MIFEPQDPNFEARGRVIKPGGILTVCAGDAYALIDSEEKTIATMLATMMAIYERPERPARAGNRA